MLYENPVARPAAEPSGAVATVAGALALSGAAANLFGALRLGIDFLDDPGRFDNSLAAITFLSGLLLAGVLTYGAVLLFRRDESGRYIVIVAAGVWAAIAAAGLLGALLGYQSDYGFHWFAESSRLADTLFATSGIVGAVTALIDGDWVSNLAGLIIPLFTVLAATSRYTARWIAAPRPPRYPISARYSDH
ncbi:hypothetical protein [Nocardia sp. NPDC050710]|uniref:hypothetical protein n=1 Tax=Nocardia sp. NPDC050710 TaxID=3157220 RepID=UPI0033F63312